MHTLHTKMLKVDQGVMLSWVIGTQVSDIEQSWPSCESMFWEGISADLLFLSQTSHIKFWQKKQYCLSKCKNEKEIVWLILWSHYKKIVGFVCKLPKLQCSHATCINDEHFLLSGL